MTYYDAVLADSPLALYKLDDPVGNSAYLDSSPNNHNINTVVAEQSYATGRNSASPGALYAYYGLSTPVSLYNESGFTVEFFLLADTSYNEIIGGTAFSTHFPSTRMEYSEDPSHPGVWVFKFGIGTGTWALDPAETNSHILVFTDDATGIMDGKWHHIVFTWSGTSTTALNASQLQIWIDGVRRDSATTRSTVSGITAPISFPTTMNICGLYDNYINGNMTFDDVAIYSPALPSSRVVEHYNRSSVINTLVETDTTLAPITYYDTLPTIREFDFAVHDAVAISYPTIAIHANSAMVADSLTDDMLLGRAVLGSSGTTDVDLSNATLESGEPNAAGYTGTVWFELNVTSDSTDQERVVLTSPTSVGSVSIYTQPGFVNGSDDPNTIQNQPSFGSFILVQADSTDQVFTLDTTYDGPYFLQVGLISGAGDDFTLSWGDASPGPGGSFEGAIDIFGVAGNSSANTSNAWLEVGEPNSTGIVETRSIWFYWTAPDVILTPTVFTALGDGVTPFSMEVYTGTEVGSLAQIDAHLSTDGSPSSIQFTATPGTGYYIRIATTEDDINYALSWQSPAQVFPAVEPVQHLRVTVHAGVSGCTLAGVTYTANQLITELPNRSAIQFQESLNVPGSGAVSVRVDDKVLRAFGPDDWPVMDDGDWTTATLNTWSEDPFQLVKTGNIIKFWMYNSATSTEECVSGFIIKARSITVVGSGENADRVINLSGPTVHQLLEDFLVLNPNFPDIGSSQTRTFSWASINHVGNQWEIGGWLDTTGNFLSNKRAWNNPTNVAKFTNPPGWHVTHSDIATKRPKYALVRATKPAWPDTSSMWMWEASNKAWNQDTRFPTPDHTATYYHYYRAKGLTIPDDTHSYRLSIYSDTKYEVWLDGALFMAGNGNENYTRFQSKTVYLRKTTDTRKHSLAIFVYDTVNSADYDHNDAMVFTLQQLSSAGKVVKTLLRSNNTQWWAWHGANPPQWSRAMILKQVISEAQARGNEAANALSIRSDFGHKSEEGLAWWDEKVYSTNIQVGTSILDLQAQFSESNKFDLWVDPDNLSVKAWQGSTNGTFPRGVDRHQNVALVPGYNLTTWTVNETDNVKNRLLVQYNGGYVYVSADSIGNYDTFKQFGSREGYLELGNYNSPAAAVSMAQAILSFTGKLDSNAGAGDITGHVTGEYTGSVLPVRGAVPFLDWNVGDTITAPGSNGTLQSHRVLSISCTEDENGNLTFDPELQGV